MSTCTCTDTCMIVVDIHDPTESQEPRAESRNPWSGCLYSFYVLFIEMNLSIGHQSKFRFILFSLFRVNLRHRLKWVGTLWCSDQHLKSIALWCIFRSDGVKISLKVFKACFLSKSIHDPIVYLSSCLSVYRLTDNKQQYVDMDTINQMPSHSLSLSLFSDWVRQSSEFTTK